MALFRVMSRCLGPIISHIHQIGVEKVTHMALSQFDKGKTYCRWLKLILKGKRQYLCQPVSAIVDFGL